MSSNSPPAPVVEGINAEDPLAVERYLGRVNTELSEMEAGLLVSGLRPGMAGYGQSTGYALPHSKFDAAPAGVFLKKS